MRSTKGLFLYPFRVERKAAMKPSTEDSPKCRILPSINDGKATKANVKNEEDRKMKNSNKAEVEKKTDEYVIKINEQADMEKRAWIEQGRLISEYIEEVKELGKKRDQALKALQDHPNSIHRYSQLRNYKQSYDLYKALEAEEDVPELPMAHFVAVDKKGLTFHKKRDLLAKADEEGLSVSKLKAAVKDALGNRPVQKTATEKFKNRLDGIYADFSAICKEDNLKELSDVLHDEIGTSLLRILRLALLKEFIAVEDLDMYGDEKQIKEAA